MNWARKKLRTLLDRFIRYKLIIDANVNELEERYWEVNIKIKEDDFYDGVVRKILIGTITREIDKVFEIYTDIRFALVGNESDEEEK